MNRSRESIMIDFIIAWLGVPTVQINLLNLVIALGVAFRAGVEVGRRHNSEQCHESVVLSLPAPPVAVESEESQKSQQKGSQSQSSEPVVEQQPQSKESLPEPCGQLTAIPHLHHNSCSNASSSSSKKELHEQMLTEKVEFQMKKLQTTSFFEMRLEPSTNSKYMRKIEKHELITDYELGNQGEGETRVVPYESTPIAPLIQSNSLLNVVAHQQHQGQSPLYSPLCQRKFVNLNKVTEEWRQGSIASWLLETGRFDKFFKSARVLGRGGFGKVLGAWSVLEQRQFAVKKMVVEGRLKMGELMNEVNVLGRKNHPNIIQYHHCWIELATIDEAMEYSSVSLNNKLLKSEEGSESKEKLVIYAESNSGFTFEKSSTKKERKSSKVEAGENAIALRKSQGQQQQGKMFHLYTLHIQMELCETTLHTHLRQRQSVDPAEMFRFFEQTVRGVYFLHAHNIVHRDLKPGNILLMDEGKRVKIGDFGLATLINEQPEAGKMQKVGTPLYMAPQLSTNAPLDRHQLFLVDVFSLGVIYYEMLHLLHECTQHQRGERLGALQLNKVAMGKELREEKRLIKLMTKVGKRPSLFELVESKEYHQLKEKHSQNV